MTREQALNENIYWLQMLANTATEEQASAAARACDAALAGAAGVQSSEGYEVFRKIRDGFLKLLDR
jgi:hypothetical protein